MNNLPNIETTEKWEDRFDREFRDKNSYDKWKTTYIYTKEYTQYPSIDDVKDFIRAEKKQVREKVLKKMRKYE